MKRSAAKVDNPLDLLLALGIDPPEELSCDAQCGRPAVAFCPRCMVYASCGRRECDRTVALMHSDDKIGGAADIFRDLSIACRTLLFESRHPLAAAQARSHVSSTADPIVVFDGEDEPRYDQPTQADGRDDGGTGGDDDDVDDAAPSMSIDPHQPEDDSPVYSREMVRLARREKRAADESSYDPGDPARRVPPLPPQKRAIELELGRRPTSRLAAFCSAISTFVSRLADQEAGAGIRRVFMSHPEVRQAVVLDGLKRLVDLGAMTERQVEIAVEHMSSLDPARARAVSDYVGCPGSRAGQGEDDFYDDEAARSAYDSLLERIANGEEIAERSDGEIHSAGVVGSDAEVTIDLTESPAAAAAATAAAAAMQSRESSAARTFEGITRFNWLIERGDPIRSDMRRASAKPRDDQQLWFPSSSSHPGRSDYIKEQTAARARSPRDCDGAVVDAEQCKKCGRTRPIGSPFPCKHRYGEVLAYRCYRHYWCVVRAGEECDYCKTISAAAIAAATLCRSAGAVPMNGVDIRSLRFAQALKKCTIVCGGVSSLVRRDRAMSVSRPIPMIPQHQYQQQQQQRRRARITKSTSSCGSTLAMRRMQSLPDGADAYASSQSMQALECSRCSLSRSSSAGLQSPLPAGFGQESAQMARFPLGRGAYNKDDDDDDQADAVVVDTRASGYWDA
jgi:phage terminase Nu1 subunit (DNA packaging protein)